MRFPLALALLLLSFPVVVFLPEYYNLIALALLVTSGVILAYDLYMRH